MIVKSVEIIVGSWTHIFMIQEIYQIMHWLGSSGIGSVRFHF